jgi:hypothetical protein
MSASQIRPPRHLRPRLVTLALLAAVLAIWVWTAAIPAQASGGTFRETGNLHKISKNGASFNEKGPATGTYRGTLTLYLTTTPKGVTFRILGNPSGGGSLIGHGSATIESEGKIGKVSGTAVLTSGTGHYAHAHGTGIKVGGTFNRETYALAITLDGYLSY